MQNRRIMSRRKEAKRARRPDLLEKRERQHQKAIEFKQEQQRIQQERMNELLEKYVKSDEFKRREAEAKAKKESEEICRPSQQLSKYRQKLLYFRKDLHFAHSCKILLNSVNHRIMRRNYSKEID